MNRPLSALVLAALLLLSPIAGAGGAVAAGPGGMVTVAEEQVTSNVPQHAQDRIPTSAQAWKPQASSHAADLQVEITTESVVKGKANSPVFDTSTNDLVIQFTDNVNHEGRTVAVDASTLEETVGYRPTFAYGRHEDGSTWKRPISYEDGVASWEIPHFSTNSVTFDGSFSLTATPAADGDQFSWNTSDGGENLVINVTGETNTEWDNETKSGVKGESVGLSVGGTTDPKGPSPNGEPVVKISNPPGDGDLDVALQTSNDDLKFVDSSGNVVDTGIDNILIVGPVVDFDGDGSAEILFRDSNDNLILYDTVDESTTDIGINVGGLGGVGDVDGDSTVELVFQDSNNNLKTVEPDGTTSDLGVQTYDPGGVGDVDDDGDMDVAYQDTSGSIKTVDSGGNVVTVVSGGSDPSGIEDINGDGQLEIAYVDIGNVKYTDVSGNTVDMGVQTRDLGGVGDFDGDGDVDVVYSADSDDVIRWVDDAGNTGTTSTTGFYLGKSLGDLGGPIDADIDLDGDGTNEASVSGLPEGSSTTKEVSSLSTSTDSAYVTGGPADVTFKFEEITQTKDPVVELNGNSESYAGTLSDGQTVTITTNDSHLVAGENVMNVSVGDGTLSADAPTPQVEINVTHDVVTSKSIDFQAEAFSERYNASKTWESNTSSAQFTVSWASSRVVKVRDVEVEYYDDTGSLIKTDSSPTYTLENGTVTVQLGDVQAGWRTEVHLDGSKVQVQNGSIKVLEATPAGHKLDTKIEITNQTAGFGISLGGTSTGEYTHYTTDESWTDSSTFVEEHANGKQILRAPNAPDAATMRVQYVPLEVDPKSGAVEVEIVDAATPKFRIRQGDLAGSDEVHIRYHDVVTGETWRLYSVSAGEEVMRDEAESPVELITDDSAETYILEIVTGSSSTTNPPPSTTTAAGSPVSLVVLIGAVIAAIVGLMVIGRRYFGATGLRDNTVLLVGGTIVGLVAVEYIGGGSLFGWMASVIGTAAGGFAASTAGTVAGAVAMLIGLYVVNSRLIDLPNWLWIISAGAIGVWVIDEVTGGALSAGLSEVSPLLWLAAAGAVIVVIWRFVGPRPVKVVGGGS